MKPADIKVGGRYTNGVTTYRVDAIHEDRMISATPLVAPLMPKKAVGRKRVRFMPLGEFAEWALHELPLVSDRE